VQVGHFRRAVWTLFVIRRPQFGSLHILVDVVVCLFNVGYFVAEGV
jgi:hypothetical protein